MRGILAAVLLASVTVAVPAAPAAGSEHVVYEVVMHRLHGARETKLTVTAATDGKPGIIVMAQLRPGDDGYEIRSAIVGQYSNGRDGYSTYGWPVAAPACPTSCAASYKPVKAGFVTKIEPTIGTRYLVAGPRGKLRVSVADKAHWRVRQAATAFRTVTAKQSDATGVTWLGTAAEHFRKSSAPGGRYGSMAFGQVPCFPAGVGSATLKADNGAEGWGIFCDGVMPWDIDFAETDEAARWTLSGDVVGTYTSPYRLAVLDFPKP